MDVSRHLDESSLAARAQISHRGSVDHVINHDIKLDVIRFAMFCLCSLSTWTSGRRLMVTCHVAKRLVHIISSADDLLVLEFCALALGNCATEAEGSSVVVLGAPSLCRMLKSRR